MVELNGQPLVTLNPDEYTRLELRPGTYKLAIPEKFLGSKSVPVEMTVESGMRYFVLAVDREENVRPTLTFVGTLPVFMPRGTLHSTFSIYPVDSSNAAPSVFERMFFGPPVNRALPGP